ncbi:DnaD domain-containing protein [Paenibacillus sp. WLX1005]|uniref:DnaD domain-containing protein n=1 Tax=unclassified Paenibacillus TaxID=185978 RepID=UPI0039845ADF
MGGEQWKSWAQGAAYAMGAQTANIPYALLKYYQALDLDDAEAMLLLQLLSFRQVEHNEFPTLEELEWRTGAAPAVIASRIQKLMKSGFITIEDEQDPLTGVRYERYDLAGLYVKLGTVLASEQQERSTVIRQAEEAAKTPAAKEEERERNLFIIFEKEFARPLSPMECETISGWMDQDRYAEELILMALKEAVFAGKLHFRYIDRILLEWNRNRIRTPDDVRAYTQKFRQR